MWPWSEGQIQTSVQAGGMASERMRRMVSGSRIILPVGAR